MPENEEGRKRGFCFVEFETYDQLHAALDRDNDMLDGRTLSIRKAQKRR